MAKYSMFSCIVLLNTTIQNNWVWKHSHILEVRKLRIAHDLKTTRWAEWRADACFSVDVICVSPVVKATLFSIFCLSFSCLSLCSSSLSSPHPVFLWLSGSYLWPIIASLYLPCVGTSWGFLSADFPELQKPLILSRPCWIIGANSQGTNGKQYLRAVVLNQGHFTPIGDLQRGLAPDG